MTAIRCTFSLMRLLLVIMLVGSLTGHAQSFEWRPMAGLLDRNSFEFLVRGDSLIVAGNGISFTDGSSWAQYPVNPLLSTPSAVCFHNDTLYAAGYYSSVHRFNGASWEQVGDTFRENPVIGRLISHEGKLIAIGRFDSIGSKVFNGPAEWDGQEWIELRGGLNGSVRDMEVWKGELYASGTFKPSFAAERDVHFAKWQNGAWVLPDSSNELSSASSIYLSDSLMFISNVFDQINGENMRGLISWNGADYRSYYVPGSSTPRGITMLGNEVYGYRLWDWNVNTWDYIVVRYTPTSWVQVGEIFDGYLIDLANYKDQLVACGSFGNVGPMRTGNVAIWSNEPLGLEYEADYESQLFPNPAQNHLFLGRNTEKYQIINSSGILVLEGDDSNKIDISDLPSGSYIVLMQQGLTIKAGRFVKIP